MFKQIRAMIYLSLAGIPERRWSSLSVVVAVALMVLVLLGTLALSNGFVRILSNSGSADVAIMLQDGAVGESNSTISRVQQDLVGTLPGIAQDANGRPIFSRELYMIVDGTKADGGERVNLALRGVDPGALLARSGVTLTAGRMLRGGSRELVVGSALVGQFENLNLGRKYRIGSEDWTVVGIISSGGGIFDSELWAAADTVQALFRRGNSVQTIRAQLVKPGGIKQLKAAIAADTRIGVSAQTERRYYGRQAASTTALIKGIGIPLTIVMTLGALAGTINAMNASVMARAQEIATVRRLGFGRLSTMLGTMAESLALALVGAMLGCALGLLLFEGRTASSLGSNFTHTTFQLELGSAQYATAAIWALVLGLAGGLTASIRTVRRPILELDAD